MSMHIERQTNLVMGPFSAFLDHTAGRARFCEIGMTQKSGDYDRRDTFIKFGVGKAELAELIQGLQALHAEMEDS